MKPEVANLAVYLSSYKAQTKAKKTKPLSHLIRRIVLNKGFDVKFFMFTNLVLAMVNANTQKR